MLCVMFVFVCNVFAADGIVPAGVNVSIRYQYQKLSAGNSSKNSRKDKEKWTSASVTLRDFLTEKAMIEEIRRRNPDCMVRILAADPGEDKVLVVRYKMLNKDNKWETHKTVLTNALTMSMAKNQILAKNQDAKVRILSMMKKNK